MESAALTGQAAGGRPGVVDKGLKKNAIGYLSNLVISVASVAPGYSLAATLGFIVAVAGVGLAAPAILIVAFVPMLFIAAAYRYMNRADPDCGTTFSWVTRAMGPQLGWLGGWAIVVSDVIVMASLAQIAGIYTFLLFRADGLAESTVAVTIVGVLWIAVMTWITYVGIELSARTQRYLLGAEVLTLATFAIVALVKVYAGDPPGSIEPQLSWFSPFAVESWSALVGGVLLAIFIYWGWDSGVAVNEESEDSSVGPGKAAVVSTIVLVLIYVVVATAAQAIGGERALVDNSDDVLAFLGGKVFPEPLDLLVIVAVLTSAAASTQTTILPTARTTLSMARQGAMPSMFGRIHPRYLTPTVSTLLMGAVSIVWYVAIVNLSTNVLEDSLVALGLLISFYYGITGFSCTIYYRREIFKNARNFFLVGVAPLLGGLILFAVFVKSLIDSANPEAATAGAVLGIGLPAVIGVGSLLAGVVLMLILWGPHRQFFSRRPETAEPGILDQPPTGESGPAPAAP